MTERTTYPPEVNQFEGALGRVIADIKVGRYRAGHRLPPERDLSEQLGISRVTMRSVVRALQQAGYVRTQRGRSGGSFVVWEQEDDSAANPVLGDEMRDRLLDMLTFRSVLEPGAAELAASASLLPDQIATLRARLQDTLEARTADYRRTDSRLHLYLAELAGSNALTDAIGNIQLMLNETLLQVVPVMKPARDHSNEQHTAIVDAVITGEPSRARAAMHAHVCATTELVRIFLSSPSARA